MAGLLAFGFLASGGGLLWADTKKDDQGYFSTFPGLYTLFAGNPMGAFDKTINDIIICGKRALYQVDEQAEAMSDVHQVVG